MKAKVFGETIKSKLHTLYSKYVRSVLPGKYKILYINYLKHQPTLFEE